MPKSGLSYRPKLFAHRILSAMQFHAQLLAAVYFPYKMAPATAVGVMTSVTSHV